MEASLGEALDLGNGVTEYHHLRVPQLEPVLPGRAAVVDHAEQRRTPGGDERR